MPLTVRAIAQGPALGDFFDRLLHRRWAMAALLGSLAVAFVLVSFLAPMVGLLLLAALLMVGISIAAYSRREVHGHGRLVHGPGHRR